MRIGTDDRACNVKLDGSRGLARYAARSIAADRARPARCCRSGSRRRRRATSTTVAGEHADRRWHPQSHAMPTQPFKLHEVADRTALGMCGPLRAITTPAGPFSLAPRNPSVCRLRPDAPQLVRRPAGTARSTRHQPAAPDRPGSAGPSCGYPSGPRCLPEALLPRQGPRWTPQ